MHNKFGVKDRRDLPVFIHSELDDFGLDPFEFRVYARLVRRAGSGGTAYESVPNVAKATHMSQRKVRYALRVLCALGLVGLSESRTGDTSIYVVLDKVRWASRSEVARIRSEALEPDPEKKPKHKTPALDAAPPAPHAGVPLHHMQPPPAPGAAKGTPLKVLPFEGSPEKEASLKKPEKAQELIDLYNSQKPPAWSSCKSLNEKRRRAIAALYVEHGQETLEIFRAALAFVNASDWWRPKDFTIAHCSPKTTLLSLPRKPRKCKRFQD